MQDTPISQTITQGSLTFPSLLGEIADPPRQLYCRGNSECWQRPCIAIVGSRKPTPQAKENAYQYGYVLAKAGFTIVSGLALGIDACAHQGALSAQGYTVAVMATGIDIIYPRRHQVLAADILATGALITELPPGTQPLACFFPRRNRIISGMSCGVLVIEATLKSGSLITARLAIEQNRDVFALPGACTNPQARGCNYLIKQGAQLIEEPIDILQYYNKEVRLESTAKIVQNSADIPSGLAKECRELVECIGDEVTSIDTIIRRSGFSVQKVTELLLECELAGSIQTEVGGYCRQARNINER